MLLIVTYKPVKIYCHVQIPVHVYTSYILLSMLKLRADKFFTSTVSVNTQPPSVLTTIVYSLA